MKKSISPHHKEILMDVIEKYLPEAKVYLFGSRAKNTHQPGADVDIALDCGVPIDSLALAYIRGDLEESALLLFVDMIDVHSVDEKFLAGIKKEWVA